MLMRMRGKERGIAMVVVLLVTLVLVSLSLVVVQLATHSSGSGEIDQRRVEAVHLAERGLNEYLALFGGAMNLSDICGTDGVPQTVSGSINQTYTLQITLDVGGTETECEDYTGTYTDLDELLIESSATIGTSTSVSGAATRTLQERVSLSPVYTEALDQAIYGATNVTISNNTTVRHYQDENDANIYAGCDLGSTVANQKFSAGFELEGSLVSQCNIYNVQGYVLGNIWTKGDITTGSLCVGHYVNCGGGLPESDFGWITSTQGNVDLGSTWVEHSCTAATGSLLNTVGSPLCGAYLYPSGDQSWMTNTPVTGIYNDATCPSKVAAVTMYDTSMCDDPPVIGFPDYTYDMNKWVAEGYAEYVPPDCATAKTHVEAIPTQDEVINLTGFNCDLAFASSSLTFTNDLAIVSRGAITWSQQTQWSGAGSDPLFYFIHPSSPAEPSADSCDIDSTGGTNYRADNQDDISIGNQTNFNNLNVYLYTPCTINAANNSDLYGQMIAGNVNYSGMGNLNFQKTTVPGIDPVGYTAAPEYVREIEN